MKIELSHYTAFRNSAPRKKDVNWHYHMYYMEEHKKVVCHR